MKKLLLILASLAIILWANIVVAAPDEPPHYNIAIKEAGPFAHQVNGQWRGLSVDLINMLSESLGFTFTFTDAGDIKSLIGMVTDKYKPHTKVDMSIAALSLTEEREKVLDFSHPYFSTPQGILTHENGNYFWFIGKKVLKAVGVLLVVSVVVGFIISRVNRKDDIKTTEDGAWFAIVTATTTGYGDKVPLGHMGRLVAVILMLSSMFLMPVFTSHITSALTVEKLANDITTLADLEKAKTVTIMNSTSDRLLSLIGIKHGYVDSLAAGVGQVKSGQVKAFVYDKAMLDYLALREDNSSLVVHPINSGQERYGIAFPTGSELREPFNVVILNIIDSPEWKQLVAQYFGT